MAWEEEHTRQNYKRLAKARIAQTTIMEISRNTNRKREREKEKRERARRIGTCS